MTPTPIPEEVVELAAAAIWAQHQNKLDPQDQTSWKEAAPLGRGITLAYARAALTAAAPLLSPPVPSSAQVEACAREVNELHKAHRFKDGPTVGQVAAIITKHLRT